MGQIVKVQSVDGLAVEGATVTARMNTSELLGFFWIDGPAQVVNGVTDAHGEYEIPDPNENRVLLNRYRDGCKVRAEVGLYSGEVEIDYEWEAYPTQTANPVVIALELRPAETIGTRLGNMVTGVSAFMKDNLIMMAMAIVAILVILYALRILVRTREVSTMTDYIKNTLKGVRDTAAGTGTRI